MGVNLARHPLIDLKQSIFDKIKSNPREGIYVWKKKVYCTYDKAPRPEHWLTWIRYDLDRTFSEFKYKKSIGYRPVTVDEGLYCAENLAPNADGYYVLGDVVLVQYPLIKYVIEKLEEDARTSKGGRERLKAIQSEIDAHGKSLPEEYYEKYGLI